MIESAGADIREGDILILHTGWHRYYEGQPQQDLVRYFCYHPGPNLDTLHWMLKKKIKWCGMDTGSGDHAMNTSIRYMRPDLAKEFTKKHGKTPAEFFGTFEYTHKRSGRQVVGRHVSVPQLGVPGRPAARREPRRRHRADARQALPSSAPSRGATRASKAARAGFSHSPTPATMPVEAIGNAWRAASSSDSALQTTQVLRPLHVCRELHQRLPIFAASQTVVTGPNAAPCSP